MVRSICLLCLLAWCFGTGEGTAAEKQTVLKACLSDVSAAPLTYPDREGIAQYLARRAGEAIGIPVEFVVEPRKRCIDNVARGKYQLLLVSGNTPSLREQFAYPMRGDSIDQRRTAGPPQTGTLIYATKSSVRWDGTALSGLHEPVLIRAGNAGIIDWLKKNQLPYIEVRASTQIVSMLQSGRGESAILRDDDLREVRASVAQFVDLKINELPVLKLDMYISANREFASQNAALMERFWNEVAHIQSRPGWKTLEPRFY